MPFLSTRGFSKTCFNPWFKGIPPKWGIGILRFRDQAPGVGEALR